MCPVTLENLWAAPACRSHMWQSSFDQTTQWRCFLIRRDSWHLHGLRVPPKKAWAGPVCGVGGFPR